MANTSKQRKKIEQDLFSRFTHPSPALKKKWEKRREEKGNGQDVVDLEFSEWMNEGKELDELIKNYQGRLADELWNTTDFKQDVLKARAIYLKNISLPPLKRDYECLWRLNQKLMGKYHLNNGWLLWLTHCLQTNENDPGRISLYDVRIGGKGKEAKYTLLEIYFPLPQSVYEEIIVNLRMKESETFGDYYSQKQSGGRLKRSRPRETLLKYNKILNYRNSARWRGKTNKEFLEYFPQFNPSELKRAKRWEKEGKPGL